jgi:hypothetical protein
VDCRYRPFLNHENDAFAFVAPDELASYVEPDLVEVNRRAVDAACACDRN